MNIMLTTACETKVVNADLSDIIIPAGTAGRVIDIIIEDGKVQFLLEFADLDTIEWYSVDEVEEKF